MTDEPAKPKIFDMKGNAVEIEGETPEQVWEVLHWAEANLKGETHTGIGITVIDHMGRAATHHFWKAGSGLQTIAGSALLQARMIANYEKLIDERGLEP